MPKFTIEVEFDILGHYSPGRPAKGPSYSSGGEPPEPTEAEVEDLRAVGYIRWDGKKHVTTWVALSRATKEELLSLIQNDDHLRELAEDAIEEYNT